MFQAFVEKEIDIEPNPAKTLTVAVSGSVLETFYQPIEYYTGFHILILIPKLKLSTIEMLIYTKYISANKFRYSYGRQANKTLKDLLIPENIPQELINQLNNYYNNINSKINSKPVFDKKLPLKHNKWKKFKLTELFEIKGSNTPLLDCKIRRSRFP